MCSVGYEGGEQMENLKQVINLLYSVASTMDTISVVGIDNQDKFVGCANVVKNVAKKLEEVSNKLEEMDVNKEEENG